jgi:PAS domain S-box-containing protein
MSTAHETQVEDPAIELMLGYSPLPMWICDRHTRRFLAVNDAAIERYGYTREEFLAMTLLDIRPAETVPRLLESLAHHPDGLVPYGLWLHRTKDGAIFDVNITSHRVIYNQHDAVLVTAQDISEQIQVMRDLRESEERYRNLFETMAQGVVYHDASGAIISANPAAEHILGLTLAQMQGLYSIDPRWRAIHEDSSDFPGDTHPAMVALREGRAVRDVVMGVYHPLEGAYRWININAVPQFREGETRPHQVYATFEDITLRKEFETTLEQRVQERTAALLHANRVKDEFLANMSHELRTPLQSILGFTEMLAGEVYAPVNDAQRNALAMITESGEHLLQLINDVLDLSKIEAGMMALELELIDVEGLCRNCLSLVRTPARERGVTLSLAVDLDLHLCADARRLRQILVNLLDNAVKFTPAGGKVLLEAGSDGQNGVRFTVEDNGPGIAADQLERIFAPFVQVESGLARTHEGAGLGLALVRRLVGLHGGAVTVDSTPGVGSRFHVTLPGHDCVEKVAAPAPEAAAGIGRTYASIYASASTSNRETISAASPPHSAPGVEILVAEDNETTARIMASYLQAVGYTVTLARNGLEVLELLAKQRPALILMDIQMPQLDGLETLRRLRSDERYARIPIIALTALAMAGDRERCLAAGASDYVSKPVRLRELAEVIQRHLSGADERP